MRVHREKLSLSHKHNWNTDSVGKSEGRMEKRHETPWFFLSFLRYLSCVLVISRAETGFIISLKIIRRSLSIRCDTALHGHSRKLSDLLWHGTGMHTYNSPSFASRYTPLIAQRRVRGKKMEEDSIPRFLSPFLSPFSRSGSRTFDFWISRHCRGYDHGVISSIPNVKQSRSRAPATIDIGLLIFRDNIG